MRKVLLLLMSCITLVVNAQNTPLQQLRQEIDYFLAPLDKDNIETGLLMDKSFDYIDFSIYDGKSVSDTNYVDKIVYKSMLKAISSASVTDSLIPPVAQIITNWHNMTVSNYFPLSIALFKYDYLPESSFQNNLVSIYNGQIYADEFATKGSELYPYSQSHLFGFTPAVNCCDAGSVTYRISSQLFFTNEDIVKVEFDPGDGSGYNEVSFDEDISVFYPNSLDYVNLYMRITTSSGDIFLCTSPMYILQPSAIHSNAISPPESLQYTYNNINVTCTITKRLANGRTIIQKPLIIAEGFDPEDISALEKESKYGFCDIDSFPGIKDTDLSDYDIIYVDWHDSDQFIQANAELLIKVIEKVNSEKASNAEKNIVLGHSMGGLIARYALCKMEERGIHHDTSMYISFDSPHLGVNIPLGMLYMASDLYSFLQSGLDNNASASFLFIENLNINVYHLLSKYYNAPSVKQMLINYVDENGNIDNTVHDTWLSELNSLGFPKGDPGYDMALLAVSNGGATSMNQVTEYLRTDISAYFWGTILLLLADDYLGISLHKIYTTYIASRLRFIDRLKLGNHTITGSFSVRPFNYNNILIYQSSLQYEKKFRNGTSLYKDIMSNSRYSPSFSVPMDNLPGSTYEVPSSMQSSNSSITHKLFSYVFNSNVIDKIMFVPTASSLCYMNGSKELLINDYMEPFYLYRTSPPYIPFHGIDVRENSASHMDSTLLDWDWFEEYNRKINGPLIPKVGDEFSIEGISSGVTWESEDENRISIDSETGKVESVGESGTTRIIATYIYNGKKVVLSKHVFSQHPDVYLESVVDANNNYMVKVRGVVPEYEYSLDSLTFMWATKDMCVQHPQELNGGVLSWNLSRDCVLGCPHSDNGWQVYMKILDSGGNESNVYNIRVIPDLVYSGPEILVVNASGERFLQTAGNMNPIYWNPAWLFIDKLDTDAPDLSHALIKTSVGIPTIEEVPLGRSFGSSYTINWASALIDDMLELLKPSGYYTRIIIDITLISEDGVPVQSFPFMLLYDKDFTVHQQIL